MALRSFFAEEVMGLRCAKSSRFCVGVEPCIVFFGSAQITLKCDVVYSRNMEVVFWGGLTFRRFAVFKNCRFKIYLRRGGFAIILI